MKNKRRHVSDYQSHILFYVIISVDNGFINAHFLYNKTTEILVWVLHYERLD